MICARIFAPRRSYIPKNIPSLISLITYSTMPPRKTKLTHDQLSEQPKQDSESDEVPAAKKSKVEPKVAEPAKKRAKQTKLSNAAGGSGQGKKDANAGSSSKITDLSQINFKPEVKTKDGKPWNFKVCSWNVNGVRAWLKTNPLRYLEEESPDVIVLQETKCAQAELPLDDLEIPGYESYWYSANKKGYSGTGFYSKKSRKPLKVTYGMGIKEHDQEGRLIVAEFDKFYVLGCYVPNAGEKLKRLDYRMEWDKALKEYLKKLDGNKPLIYCGDLNVAHNPIDLANPKSNARTAGFTKEERDSFSDLLAMGFVDSFRHLYPDVTGAYSYWSYRFNARAKNTGWRLDYFVVSNQLVPQICDCVIRKEVLGSDHCPIILFLSTDI
jgi:AP endonuclease-1